MRKAVSLAIAAALIAATVATVAVMVPRGPKMVTLYIYDLKAKPPGAKPPPSDPGYEILGKWKKLPVSFVYTEGCGISEGDMANALAQAVGVWDSHTRASLLGVMTHVTNANFDTYADGTNEISFGNYKDANVIAVCRMWVTRGPASRREIVEFDMMFDTDFAWGDATKDATLMDLQNIATHELGHGIAGLGDIYDGKWSYLTMYGYSTEGDIQKRTIEGTDTTGDIGGVKANYGP